ncbi:hypothetical protein [Cupriavidus metallidurans]|uniref:hypothetical protein n=1 Tax=Cupriavidus metallidurans TaxID=119219 RepID=UPI001CCF8FEF|nr:hypothetical protein [Cupriavidus metallidurans]UBM08816.1 hypothetical protein LAI70_02655 [Cupriavidus metallidurans]
MTKDELHAFLIAYFDLVVDSVERGNRRSYFLRRVIWHPSSSTRILHVQYDDRDAVTHIKRCVSSDNNNSVFAPLGPEWLLREAVSEEIDLHWARCNNH